MTVVDDLEYPVDVTEDQATDEAFADLLLLIDGKRAAGPSGDDLQSWRAWMGTCYQRRIDAGRTPEQALALALSWGEGECEMHRRRGDPPAGILWRDAACEAMLALGLKKPLPLETVEDTGDEPTEEDFDMLKRFGREAVKPKLKETKGQARKRRMREHLKP
jgi:hypothetical protein